MSRNNTEGTSPQRSGEIGENLQTSAGGGILPTAKKIIYYDILKILACFTVIINHTGGLMILDNPQRYQIIFYLSFFHFSKIGVPLFIMVSGALLLGRDDDPKRLYLKRIPRILLVLIVFSTYVFVARNGISPSLLPTYIKTLLAGPVITPYWYLYMLVGLYLVTPFIQRMVRNFTETDYRSLFLISFLMVSTLPIILYYLKITVSSLLIVNLFSGYVVYFIIGYYLKSRETSKKGSLTAWITLISTILVSVILMMREYDRTGELVMFLDNVNYITTVVPSVAAFYLVKHYATSHEVSEKSFKAIRIVSDTTFGIYLIHALLQNRLRFIFDFFSIALDPVPSTFLFQVTLFVICFILIYPLKKIPLVRQFL